MEAPTEELTLGGVDILTQLEEAEGEMAGPVPELLDHRGAGEALQPLAMALLERPR